MPDNNTVPNLNIFISYAHQDASEFASRLCNFLRHKNYSFLWFDRTNIITGREWDLQIEKAIENLKSSPENNRFLLLMTQKSVGRPSGYCINELTYALDCKLNIIPIKLQDITPPLSIYRLQYIDCLPFIHSENEEELFKLIDRTIVNNNLDKEGVFVGVKGLMQPLDFSHDLAFLLRKYHERGWIDDKIQSWLNNPSVPNVMCIAAGPGYGKSSISAHLVSRNKDIIAFHLCKRNDRERSNLKNIITTISYQLLQQLDGYKDLIEEVIKNYDLSKLNSYELFNKLISQPLNRIGYNEEDGSKIILVDALDESSMEENNSIEYLLTHFAQELPSWVRIIVTTRPIPRIMSKFMSSYILNLELADFKDENNENLSSYIDEELSQYETHPSYKTSKDIILENAAGVFLYVARICRDISNGVLGIDAANSYPLSMNEYYTHFFKKFSDAEYKKVTPFIAVVLAAKEPLTLQEMALLLDTGTREITDMISKFGDMIRVNDDKISIYHASLADWFLSKENSEPYTIDVNVGNNIFVNCGLPDNGLLSYQTRNLPKHLADLKMKDKIAKLFGEGHYIGYFSSLHNNGKNDLAVEIIFENFLYIKDTISDIDTSVIFSSELFKYVLNTHHLHLFDLNYYRIVKELGYTEYLDKNIQNLEPEIQIKAISYYHTLARFDLTLKNMKYFNKALKSFNEKVAEESAKKSAETVDENMRMIAGGYNMLGVANRTTGNIFKGRRQILKAVKLYDYLKDNGIPARQKGSEDSSIIIHANAARAYKLKCRFKRCEKILKAGYAYASSLGVPKEYGNGKEYNRILHVNNGPSAIYLQYCYDTFNLKKAGELLKHFDKLYTPKETQVGRFYPLYLLNRAMYALLNEDMRECKDYLDKAKDNPARKEYAEQIETLIDLCGYFNGNKDSVLLENSLRKCKQILDNHSKGCQWEKYAEVYPLYYLCKREKGEKCSPHKEFPKGSFRRWVKFKLKWYEKVLKSHQK